MSFSITGKTAIVTGAANGIGLAIARHFADRGANVMFADMDEDKLSHEVGDKADGPLRWFAGDLREKLTLTNLVSATIDAFDRIDILINAARQVVVSDPLCPEDDGVDLLFRQNVVTALRLSQAVAKRMIRQAEAAPGAPGGAIVNLSSIAATRTAPGMLAYSMSAAALDQMTRSMAVTLAPYGIRVNGLAFGSVMSASLVASLRDHPEYRADIEAHTPLGRIASATELAEAAQYLASEGAGFMTGQIMVVDGGRSVLDAAISPAH